MLWISTLYAFELGKEGKEVILHWSVLGLAVFGRSVLSSPAKWRCQRLMFVCYVFSPLPGAAYLVWSRGFHWLLDELGLVVLEHTMQCMYCRCSQGPILTLFKAGEVGTVLVNQCPSLFQLLLGFSMDHGQKHLEVSWVVVWSCSH